MASGGCVARASLGRDGAAPCADGAAPLVESGRTACVMPAATCPRGTGRDGATCTRGLRCPAGSLPEGNACRPIVTAGGAEAPARVDVGAWVALVLGVDGGTGKPGLCSPLAQRPAAFGLEPGGAATVNIRVRLGVPDEDVSRVHATVVAADGAGHPLSPSSQSLVSVAVDTLVETLRSLGGAATAGAVEVGVHCGLTLPLRYLPLP
jgi:hypothetical protein